MMVGWLASGMGCGVAVMWCWVSVVLQELGAVGWRICCAVVPMVRVKG